MDKVKCSLCGCDTEVDADGPKAEWMLCEECEGSDEALEKGFTHT